MKTNFCLIAVALLFVTACSKKQEASSTTPVFGFSISASDTFNGALPGLQSYALGVDSLGRWLMIGGRTNGLHNFSTPAFPLTSANRHIYLFDPSTGVTDSFDLALIRLVAPRIFQQFISTNIQHFQEGNYLYLCGGYGAVYGANNTVSYVTNNIVSRVNVNELAAAISGKLTNYFNMILTDTCSQLAATGGELFRLADGRFYQAVGHVFNGEYGNAGVPNTVQPTQQYVDGVKVFSVNETSTSFSVDQGSVSTISDGLADSLTIFRRRDLVVVPALLSGGTDIGISIYGGVFTYTNSIANNGNPFHYPIYISGGSSAGYVADSSFYQRSNLYSAANLLMYSPSNNSMMTTIFGGLVDTLDLDTPNGNPANWTNQVLTIRRDYTATGSTSSAMYNAQVLPHYVGAEAQFIHASLNPAWYSNAGYGILNYDALPSGKTLLGYIYGGIQSTNAGGASTNRSNAAYPVYINK